MKWFIILLSTINVFVFVQPRPSQTPQNVVADPTVEIEKQELLEIKPQPKQLTENVSQRKIEEKTREILEKIAEVNKKQGLTPKRAKPSYFHFPFSYSRSQENNESEDRQSTSFKFPNNPFTNPIFDYLEQEKENVNEENQNYLRQTNVVPQGEQFSVTNPNAEITKDDIIPGHYIKRKITHSQTFIIPNTVQYPMNFMNYPQMYPTYPMQVPLQQIPSNYTNENNYVQNLEDQTVDNIKSIVSNSQMASPQPYYNEYYYPPLLNYPPNNNQLYGPFVVPPISEQTRPNRQFNWPGMQYFPIIIRDPFQQMFNAFTSMVEYGPTAGQPGTNACKKPKDAPEETGRSPKIADELGSDKIIIKMNNVKEDSPEITVYGINSIQADSSNKTFLNIENLDIGNSKLTLNLKKNREGKDDEDNVKSMKQSWDNQIKGLDKMVLFNSTTNRQHVGSKLDKLPAKFVNNKVQFKQSPPNREPTFHDEDDVDDIPDEDDKAEDIAIVNDNNKKVFTRENTGSGIFIQKLKVRKGGVAIAGPGGIATAGSGGTAIVGPNGIAYTHPDSLAIAGSGTKVIAVDPAINLSDIISNSTNSSNRTRLDSARVGKLVAVGPVIYYNKG